MMIRYTLILGAMLLGGGCPPYAASPGMDADATMAVDGYTVSITATDAPYNYDADSGSSACSRACNNLQAMGCPEGNPDGGDGCYMTCMHAMQSGVFDVKPDCIAAANTADMIRACGSVKCNRVVVLPH
jgi:hypothetical protein